MLCPQCGRQAECDMVDNGVGMQQCGPYGCEPCGWVQLDPCDLLVERTPAKESSCCREPLDDRGACAGCGERTTKCIDCGRIDCTCRDELDQRDGYDPTEDWTMVRDETIARDCVRTVTHAVAALAAAERNR